MCLLKKLLPFVFALFISLAFTVWSGRIARSVFPFKPRLLELPNPFVCGLCHCTISDEEMKEWQERMERRGEVFAQENVERQAFILFEPQPKISDEVKQAGAKGQIRVEVVLRNDGDVDVEERFANLSCDSGKECGIGDSQYHAQNAAQSIIFIPARKDGHPVSQKKTIVYDYGK